MGAVRLQRDRESIRRRNSSAFGTLLTRYSRNLPSGALLATISVLGVPPLGFLAWTSFRTSPTGAGESAFTLHAWETLLSSDGREAVLSTVAIGLLTTLFAIILGGIFAWLDVQTDAPTKYLSAVVLVPLIFSPLITTVAWTVLGAPRAGLINVGAARVFGDNDLINVFSLPGIVWVSAVYYVPVAYLAIRGPLRNVDASVIEAARSAGASVSAAMRRILVPIVAPAVSGAALLIFSLNIGMATVVVLLGPSARIDTLQLRGYYSMLLSPGDTAVGAAVGLTLLLASILGLLLYRFILRRPERYMTITGRGHKPLVLRLGNWRYIAALIVFLYVLVTVLVPYLAIVYGAFAPYLSPDFRLDNLSLRNFELFTSQGRTTTGMKNTLLLALVGAGATTVIASIIAYITRRQSGFLPRWLERMSFLHIAVPSLSFALGYLWFMLSIPVARENLYGTLLAIYLAQMIQFLPLGILIVGNAVIQIGREIEEAARVSGVPPRARLLHVVFPQLRPAFVSAWLFLALHVLTEAGLTLFLYTPSTVTTPVNVFLQALEGSPGVVYAGAMILATLGLVTIAVAGIFFRAKPYQES